MGTQRVLGPCRWNGNEIVMESEPLRGVAGIAQDCPDDWGYVFAAAPNMLAACVKALNYIENTESDFGITLESGDMLRAAIARTKGE